MWYGLLMTRMSNDNYPTPVADASRIVKHLVDTFDIDPTVTTVLDPACGEGNLHRALLENGFLRENLSGIEIDDALADKNSRASYILCSDALKVWWPTVSMIFMNPPYSHAMEFVRKAMDHAKNHGTIVVALLRLSFLGSQKRAAFHQEYPAHVIVLKKRMKFVGNATDTTDHAVLVWDGIHRGTWEVL